MPGHLSTRPLIVETLSGTARVDDVDRPCSLVSGMPEGDEWIVLADLLIDPTWPATGVASASIVGDIGRVALGSVAAAVMTQRRAWHVAADTLAVRRKADGRYDGLAVLSPTVRVLPADVRAGDRDAVVLDDAATLHATVAGEVVELFAQVVEVMRSRGNRDAGGSWAAVADQLGSMALWRDLGRAGEAAEITGKLRRVMASTDEGIDRALVRTRAALTAVTAVEWAGGLSAAAVRATCRPNGVPVATGGPSALSGSYCGPCPLLDEASRRALHVGEWTGAVRRSG
jgi:hypothetical protein